jgi:hypothetical protein
MGKRERFLTLLVGAIAVALGSFWTSVASADTMFTPPNIPFSDARNDFKSSRPGTLSEGRYGPVTIPANSQVHNALDFTAPAPCTNCYITDIVPQLIYDGDPNNPTGTVANLVNGMMMHHFVLINPARQDAVCPSGLQGQLGERFFASGNERTHMHLPPQYGYYNPSGQSAWTLIYHLVNKSAVDKTVSIQIYYKWRSASDTTFPPPLEAKPLWLDIDGCGDSEYTIPTGYSDTTTTWTSNVTGKMIAIAGHLHDVDITGPAPCDIHCPAEGGGIAVSAELVGGPSTYYGPVPPNNPPPASLTGTTLCRSEGYYGTTWAAGQWKGHLDTMSTCGIQTDIPAGAQAEAYPAGAAYPTTGLAFGSGQQIKLHSEYSNGTGFQQTDVMGIMVAWYAPTGTIAGYARPKGASPAYASLVPAFNQCTSGNRTHGAPLNAQSCAPPVQSSNFLTVGTPDANGAGANASASARFIVASGDVRIKVSATDVRNKSDLTDYAGQLKLATGLQITDRNNGPTETGTTVNIPISYAVPCTTTPTDTAIGSTCSIDTTANSFTPGTVNANYKTIWQMSKVNLYDGGADGVASTDPNTLFMTQGVFVP